MSTKLILVRHGQSEFNAMSDQSKVFCGQIDCQLTDVGRQQAIDVGLDLARRSELNIRWAVSSRLLRAVETLDCILKVLPGQIKVLPASSDFNERSLGEFEGRFETEVFQELPHYEIDPRFNRFRNDFEQKAPGGENYADVSQRVRRGIDSVLNNIRNQVVPGKSSDKKAANESGDILIVSHNVALKCLLHHFLGWPQEQTILTDIPNTTPLIVELADAL